MTELLWAILIALVLACSLLYQILALRLELPRRSLRIMAPPTHQTRHQPGPKGAGSVWTSGIGFW
jgi:hypothetical protein